MTKYFSWADFDSSVEVITKKCKFLKFSSIYGISRGGLCLAVALSHKLNIKLDFKPHKNSLIVDDIYETGQTLSSYKNIEGAMFFVLVSKKKPTWWNTVDLMKRNEWVVFPWENKTNIINDQHDYHKKRLLS